jgi:tRNA threonylcarbamoyladenosine biosynthesis protein TsaE
MYEDCQTDEIERISTGPDETRAFARQMATQLGPGTVLALHGDLGAGKTCFVQGLAAGLDVQQPVSSPTYTLVNEYRGRLPLYHVDLYRLHSADAALDMGLDEYLDGAGITAIEWPERAAAVLPARTRHIQFSHGQTPSERIIRLEHRATP